MLQREIKTKVKSNVISTKKYDYRSPDNYPVMNVKTTIQDQSLDFARPPSRYELPTFGIRRRTLYASDVYNNDVEMGLELVRDYHMALFKATITALNCQTVEIGTSADNKFKRTSELEYRYVRDPAVILHDKRVVISTEGNRRYCSEDIIRKVQEKTGYESLEIKNAYFEGGNIFYFPEKKILFHGLDPSGHYGLIRPSFHTKDTKLEYTKVDPVSTNRTLGKALKPFDIYVVGLRTNMDLISYKNGNVHDDYYYHLDCFMQALPDGRVVILNKNMLSESAQRRMQQIFGDDFIDLAYPDYLTKPVLLNFIAIPYESKFAIISPNLPDSIIESLSHLNLKVITPSMLDSRHAHYNRVLAERVVVELAKEGYDTMNAGNLATHLPWKNKGYALTDGKRLGPEYRDKALGNDSVPIDDYFSKNEVSFVYGAGGPHCFTTEIIPIKPKINALCLDKPKPLLPKIQSKFAFFKNNPGCNEEKHHFSEEKMAELAKINNKNSKISKNIGY